MHLNRGSVKRGFNMSQFKSPATRKSFPKFLPWCGVLLIVVSLFLHRWNETWANQTAQSLDEGLRQVVHIHNIDQVSPEYQDKLVHLCGNLQTDKALSDSDYGIEIKAVKLKRDVEEYRRIEIEDTRAHDEEGYKRTERTPSHFLMWIPKFTQSNSLPDHDKNWNFCPTAIYPCTRVAPSVRVGAFSLSKGLIGKIDAFQPLSPQEVPQGRMMYLHDGMFYLSENPIHPKEGDKRVRFSYAGLSGKPGSGLGDPMKVCIVARQQDGRLSAYHTKSGYSLEFLLRGEMSAEEIFEAKQSANETSVRVWSWVDWFLRVLGFLIMSGTHNQLVMMNCIFVGLTFRFPLPANLEA